MLQRLKATSFSLFNCIERVQQEATKCLWLACETMLFNTPVRNHQYFIQITRVCPCVRLSVTEVMSLSIWGSISACIVSATVMLPHPDSSLYCDLCPLSLLCLLLCTVTCALWVFSVFFSVLWPVPFESSLSSTLFCLRVQLGRSTYLGIRRCKCRRIERWRAYIICAQGERLRLNPVIMIVRDVVMVVVDITILYTLWFVVSPPTRCFSCTGINIATSMHPGQSGHCLHVGCAQTVAGTCQAWWL